MSVVGGKADIMGSKADMKSPMSVFPRFTSAFGGKADENAGKADIADSDVIHIHNLFALMNYLSRIVS